MLEFMRPKGPVSATSLRHLTLEIERLTGTREGVSDKPSDEEATVGKLRELIPANVWCYIAQSARSAKT